MRFFAEVSLSLQLIVNSCHFVFHLTMGFSFELFDLKIELLTNEIGLLPVGGIAMTESFGAGKMPPISCDTLDSH